MKAKCDTNIPTAVVTKKVKILQNTNY